MADAITRFAFYGRVSTEDQQDPVSSRGWQLDRSRALIKPVNGVIVAEYFDIAQSQAVPWKRRPESASLLQALSQPDRAFSAVVIGEPQRAFHGNQFSLTFPIFIHFDVQLWVPEVGGPIDPGSDAHDMVMNMYGGMAKGERNRIKIRVRSAMAAQAATEGRFLGGRPPYGYQLVDAGPHLNPAKAAAGQRRHKLVPDPTAAPVVQRIFDEYLAGRGLYVIAEGLTRDGIPSPSGHDPTRNRHRAATRGAWGKSAVRAILANPKYTGRQVWNRQRREERLIDVDDVALGDETIMRWNDPSEWIWSPETTHEPLIEADMFAAVQRRQGAARHRRSQVPRRPRRGPYVLSALMRCGVCGRRMQGSWNNNAAHYRCKFPSEYAMTKALDHPKTVYVRESAVVPALDEWLATIFDADHIERTCEALAAASERDEAADASLEAARRKLADCDDRLGNYRAALDAGADPKVVAGWMAEVQAERLGAERVINEAGPSGTLTPAEVRALVGSMQDVIAKLEHADPQTKADLYRHLGISLTYHPDGRVIVEAKPADPCTYVRVGGGT